MYVLIRIILYAATLRRTATVMWKWCYIDNLCYLNAGSIDGANSALTTITRAPLRKP